MRLSDDEKAIIALTTRLGNRSRPSLSPGRWHALARWMRDQGLRPSDVFSGRLPTLPSEDHHRIEILLGDAASVLVGASELANRGVWICTLESDQYPGVLRHRLKTQAPPVIFGVGAAELLEEPGIGIVGSREVDELGARVAQDLAAEAVRLGYHVVSGAARGVDQLAMNAAYRAQGAVAGVLADSLQQRVRAAEVVAALDGGRTCLISQQHPDAPFSAAAAMARNKLIYALSMVTVVVASDLETGGTWAGATEALKAGYGQVGVFRGEGEGPGNRELERLGGRPISRVDQLASILAEDPVDRPTQLRLVD